MEWDVKVVILLKKGQHCNFPNTITIECYGIIRIFCGIVRAPLDLLSHKVWLLDETSLSSRIAWERRQFLDIYAYFVYPYGLPQISIDFLMNRKYCGISMDPGNLQINGKSKIFWISTGNPNYHWVSHTKCETRKTYHSALHAHIFYTSSKGKTVGVEFQQILFYFSSVTRQKQPKTKNHQVKTKTTDMNTTIQPAVFQAIGA